MRKIGIMGGTFNPIHQGHLLMGEIAREQLSLVKVYYMPSKNPPHKSKTEMASDKERCEMTQNAIRGNSNFVYSDWEQQREGMTYTSDTLRCWQERYPEDDIYFILGTDSFVSLGQWHLPEEIFKRCTIVVADREGVRTEKVQQCIQTYKEQFQAKVILLDFPRIEISSTEIRARILKGESIRYQVPESVFQYIEEHRLYQGGHDGREDDQITK